MTTYVIGDIHGHFDKLVALLIDEGLIANDLSWAGEDSTLCFLGDYFDRGPNGVGVVDLMMRLQVEASMAGGKLIALPGNHEAFFLAALRFGNQRDALTGETFRIQWIWNGGNPQELHRIEKHQIHWLSNLPAMVRLGDYLLVHADSGFYLKYGDSIDSVNNAMRAVFCGRNIGGEMSMLIDGFCRRGHFTERPAGGVQRARYFLRIYGGKQIVHGHTPIAYVTGAEPDQVTKPLVYANGLAIDLDHGLYQGGNGFIYQLPDTPQVK